MASRKPSVKDPRGLTRGNGRKIKLKAASKEQVRIKQTFTNLTIAWVTAEGRTVSTAAGFIARAFIAGRLVDTATFDRFGIARFSRIPTLTEQVVIVQVIRIADGRLFRTRSVPVGSQFFAVIP